MNAVNSVQLFVPFWAFIAVCQAGGVDLCSVSCEDVTGTVGEEVTFTCSVPQKCTKCCIVMNKFKYEDSEICRQEFPLDSCEQRNSFTCRYTPTTAMKGQSSFFVQRKCGSLNTEFTVNITEPQKRVTEDYEPRNPETVSKDYDEKVIFPKDSSNRYKSEEKSEEKKAEGRGFKVAVIAAVVSGFIIVIVPIIYKMKQNFKQKKDNCQEVV